MKSIQIALVAVLLQAATLSAQENRERLNGDARAAAIAAVEWFANQATEIRGQRGTLVISGLTSEYESSLPSAPARPVRAPRRALGLAAATLDGVGQRHGLRVATCDSITSDHSLCGIAQPWVWLVVSTPAIEGTRARLELEARGIDHAPSGERDRTAKFWDVVLEQSGSSWKVVSATPAGVS